MKKLIALALALVLALSLGSVAFAATLDAAIYGSDLDSAYNADNATITVRPGETYQVKVYDINSDPYGWWHELALSSKNWKIETKWTKGGALVDSVTLNKDDNTLDIKLKENFTITDAKGLEGEITLIARCDMELPVSGDIHLIEKGDKYVIKLDYVNALNKSWASVTNNVVTVCGEEDVEDAMEIEADNNTLYVCDEDEPGYVKFNTRSLLGCTLNMAGKEKAFMYTDESAIEALTEKFPEAGIECYKFGGTPTFKNAAKFTLQADYADQYHIYSWNGKALAEVEGVEWDSIEGVYVWETKSPTSYVISDVELVAADEEAAANKNPDTGANDVVGLAAALAVVSLAAAGAVSLKK